MAGVLRHRTTRPRRITAAALLAGLLVLGSGWAGAAARAAPPAPAAPGSPGSAAVGAAVAALVRDARIPLPDAVAGVRRQGRQRALAGELAGRLGPRYGGAWIDWIDRIDQAHSAHRGRLTVAVLDSAAAATVRRAARRAGLPDTVVVRVSHAAAALDRAARRL
ncbi:MAG TPA: hypothetical protein VFX70_02585, partial [Mycobacteriales bacterium]|nr:hypothetical protein [Mycobacteriales bacterium]